MFCPMCGSLSFPDSKNNIKCPDYKCGYEGPLSGPDGKEENSLTQCQGKKST